MEGAIKEEITLSKRFTKCVNIKCNSFFILDSKKAISQWGLFCPDCRSKLSVSHIVQCRNCQSIVNIFPVEIREEPTIYYVDKCSKCTRSIENRLKSTPCFFDEAFV